MSQPKRRSQNRGVRPHKRDIVFTYADENAQKVLKITHELWEHRKWSLGLDANNWYWVEVLGAYGFAQAYLADTFAKDETVYRRALQLKSVVSKEPEDVEMALTMMHTIDMVCNKVSEAVEAITCDKKKRR